MAEADSGLNEDFLDIAGRDKDLADLKLLEASSGNGE